MHVLPRLLGGVLMLGDKFGLAYEQFRKNEGLKLQTCALSCGLLVKNLYLQLEFGPKKIFEE